MRVCIIVLFFVFCGFAQAHFRIQIEDVSSGEENDAPTTNSVDTAFSDDFDGASVDDTLWSVRSGNFISVSQSELTIKSSGHHHKNLVTREKYDFGTIKARVLFGSDNDQSGDHYQRIGFGGAYIDTHDASAKANTHTVRAVCRYDNEVKTSPQIPLKWGEYHDIRVDWDPDQISFSINGKQVHAIQNTGVMDSQPIIIQNHRGYMMKVGSIEYAAIDTTLPKELVEEYDALIDQLGDSSFKVRLAAQKQIRALKVKHGMRQRLRARFKTESDLEIKLSIKDLLR